MKDKARALGMRKTHFVEPTGLSSENVSSPRDLVKLLRAVSKQPLIHRYTTDDSYLVDVGRGRQLTYNNTNRLVKNSDRSEEHTSELQSLMRISYAVFCLKKKKNKYNHKQNQTNYKNT